MTAENQMNNERREGLVPVPSDLKPYLNEDQMRTYRTMQGFGWEMYFIRRPVFQLPTVVMINHEGTHVAVIDENGRFDQDTKIELRI